MWLGLVLASSVGLATIGVCVFHASASVGALFCFWEDKMKKLNGNTSFNTEKVIYHKVFERDSSLLFDTLKNNCSMEMFEAVKKNEYIYSHSEKAIDDVEKLMELCLRMAIFTSGEMSICVSEEDNILEININNSAIQISDKGLYYLSNIAMFCTSIFFERDLQDRLKMMILYDFLDENPTVKDAWIENLTSQNKDRE